MTNQSNDTKNGAEVGQVLPNERHRNVKRSFLVLLFLALALAAMVISLVFGSADITMAKIWHTLWSSELKDTQEMVIWNIRFPRNIVAALVGANLAVAGAILQAVMKNPLADPQIVGVSSGAWAKQAAGRNRRKIMAAPPADGCIGPARRRRPP